MTPRTTTLTLLLCVACLPHAGSQDVTQRLHTYRDDVYAFDVKLGTPPQTLRLAIDLMGVGTVVAGKSCESCLDPNLHKSVYNENVSSTAEYNGGRHVHDDGSVDVGCEDTVKTLDLTSNVFTFHEVISAPPTSCFIRQPFDGVIGLRSNTLSPNIFGLYMKRTCANADDFADGAGSITHGDFDGNYCGSDLFFYISVPLENFNGSSLLSIEFYSVDAHAKRAPFDGPWRATLTTTSTDVVLPTKLFADLNAYWGAKNTGPGQWTIDCNTQHNITIDYDCIPLTPDNLTIGCAVLGPIDLQHFIYRVGDVCFLQIRPRDADDPYPDYWTLGVTFFHRFCVLFDFKDKTVTFAEPKKDAGWNSTCIYRPQGQNIPCFPQNVTDIVPIPPVTTTTRNPRLQQTTTDSGAARWPSLGHSFLVVMFMHLLFVLAISDSS